MNKVTLTRSSERGDSAVVISVLSGIDGTGKSVLSFNLSERLASLGNRVLMVDADLYRGSLHVLTNKPSEYGLNEYMEKKLDLNEAITNVSPCLDLLAGPQKTSAIDPEDAAAARRLVRRLLSQTAKYQFVVIDHGSGKTESAQAMARLSDLNILMLVPELGSISDAYGLFKQLMEKSRRLDCRILVNRVDDTDEATYIYRKFSALAERFIGKTPGFLGNLPEDQAVLVSVAAQKAVSESDEQSPFATKLHQLALKLSTEYKAGLSQGRNSNNINDKSYTAYADTRE